MGGTGLYDSQGAHAFYRRGADALSSHQGGDAAEFVDASDDWGTVAVGHRADLLLIDGTPLNNVENTTQIAGVMLRGKWLPKAELSKMLEGVAKSYEEQAE